MNRQSNPKAKNKIKFNEKLNTQLFRKMNIVDLDFKSSRKNQAMLVQDGLISWLGDEKNISKIKSLYNKSDYEEVSLNNKLVLPSFVECHTHTLFAGNRANEFELRNQGISYLEIAAQGGGILSTMKATRQASKSQLLNITQNRVDSFLKQGVSTLEIKTGYALDLKNELKCLEIIKQLKGPHIVSTFLGAHAKPPEFNSHAEYLEYLIESVLPKIKTKKLSNRIDIFVEKKFFEKKEAHIFLKKAKEMRFEIVLHANQLSLSGGIDLALKHQALSADHVIHLTSNHIQKMAQSQTVAVLLPMADLYMRCAYPPARKLIDAGATVALATDFNPGSCPSQDIMLVGLLARLEMKMSLPEIFKAYTFNAAKALNLSESEGSLELGKKANFLVTNAELTDFFYSAGKVPDHELFILGNKIKTT